MNYIYFDDSNRDNLLPLLYTRPSADIRIGILTIKEKWDKILNTNASYFTQEYLQKKFSVKYTSDNLFINGLLCPNPSLIPIIQSLKMNESIWKGNLLLAYRTDSTFEFLTTVAQSNKKEIDFDVLYLSSLEKIFSENHKAIEFDFELITKGRKSAPISKTNVCFNVDKIFIEEGVKIECSSLNANDGPIYIGANCEIMEGSKVRGPFALCEYSTLKMDAKIYGASTIGPYCKVGGEINNSVIFGYTNKAHDGFLGNAVIGEWCNLGADTNNSNLKNNYAEVRLWNYSKKSFAKTGLQFCGLIMGDHSKCGINTMFNTGTVVGVSANIFGPGFPRNFIPDFAWGGAQGFETFTTNKAIEVATKVFERRGKIFDDVEKEILLKIFDLSAEYRNF